MWFEKGHTTPIEISLMQCVQSGYREINRLILHSYR